MANIPVNDSEIPTALVIVDPPSDVTTGEETVSHIPIALPIESDTRSLIPTSHHHVIVRKNGSTDSTRAAVHV